MNFVRQWHESSFDRDGDTFNFFRLTINDPSIHRVDFADHLSKIGKFVAGQLWRGDGRIGIGRRARAAGSFQKYRRPFLHQRCEVGLAVSVAHFL